MRRSSSSVIFVLALFAFISIFTLRASEAAKQGVVFRHVCVFVCLHNNWKTTELYVTW